MFRIIFRQIDPLASGHSTASIDTSSAGRRRIRILFLCTKWGLLLNWRVANCSACSISPQTVADTLCVVGVASEKMQFLAFLIKNCAKPCTKRAKHFTGFYLPPTCLQILKVSYEYIEGFFAAGSSKVAEISKICFGSPKNLGDGG